MKKELQDKYWAELSEEDKVYYKGQYAEQKTMSESGVPELLEQLFGSHNLNPKPLTYEDMAMELFKDNAFKADLCKSEYAFDTYPLNCTSEKQAEKLLAINKLLNVAKYLNGDWKPDWSDGEQEKYFIGIDNSENKKLIIKTAWFGQYEIVYFRTEELAKQAIQILGEKTIRLALTTDY